jgi:hypothetical protein
MAEKKNQSKRTRLVHVNGATVVVPEAKSAGLLAGGLFTEPESTTTAAKPSGK